MVESTNKGRGKLWLGVAVFLILGVICTGAIGYFAFTWFQENIDTIDTQTLTRPIIIESPVNLNQIAFVGTDDNVWRVGPDGDGLQSVTDDGKGYRFPTWSPDSRNLAFVGSNEDNRPALFVSSTTNESNPEILYNNPRSAPFYLYWSPDSQSITFLTQEGSGLSMRQATINQPDNDRVLDEGAPFYWVWSPSAEKLLMHVGGSRSNSSNAHLSILTNEAEARRIKLDLAPGNFQAPVWSSDGRDFFYIAENDEGVGSIYKTHHETLEQTVITNLEGFSFMVLSPTDEHVAYAQIEEDNRAPFGTAYIVDTDGQNHRKLTDRPVGSMYWSPDGSKLAILTFVRGQEGETAKAGGLASPVHQELRLRWWIYDVTTEELNPLISFTPTDDFLQTVPYFDQYHLSLTFWSPDSRYFVITEKDNDNEKNSVMVIDTTGEESPLEVGEGTMAVWSWQ